MPPPPWCLLLLLLRRQFIIVGRRKIRQRQGVATGNGDRRRPEAATLVLEVEFGRVGKLDKEPIRDWPGHNLDPNRRRRYFTSASASASIITDGHWSTWIGFWMKSWEIIKRRRGERDVISLSRSVGWNVWELGKGLIIGKRGRMTWNVLTWWAQWWGCGSVCGWSMSLVWWSFDKWA